MNGLAKITVKKYDTDYAMYIRIHNSMSSEIRAWCKLVKAFNNQQIL